jgi:hypothetical protein
MNLAEKGIAVGKYAVRTAGKIVGAEAVLRDKGSLGDSLKAGALQLTYPKISQAGMPRGGEWILRQTAEKDPKTFWMDFGDFAVAASLFFSGYTWEAAVVKFGYNALVQIAPDVVRLLKKRHY